MEEDGLRSPTLFEVETALAMLYFRASKCDYVVLETGLGGREDATNVVTTTVIEVITPISMDHMAILGDTIAEIAVEKAGIIKPNTIVVSAKQHIDAEKVLSERCKSLGCELRTVADTEIKVCSLGLRDQSFEYRDWHDVHISLAGTYQFKNYGY